MLQVRDVPDDIHAELRRRAALGGMSLSDFARQELIRLAFRPTLGELLERVARNPGDTMSFADARESVVAERPHSEGPG